MEPEDNVFTAFGALEPRRKFVSIEEETAAMEHAIAAEARGSVEDGDEQRKKTSDGTDWTDGNTDVKLLYPRYPNDPWFL